MVISGILTGVFLGLCSRFVRDEKHKNKIVVQRKGNVEMSFYLEEEVEVKFDFFDADFNHLPFTNGHPNSSRPVLKPCGFEKMKELAAKLSVGQPHLRVDFYDIDGKIYFGELTFYHWSGMMPFDPEEWDYTFGSWIKLPHS